MIDFMFDMFGGTAAAAFLGGIVFSFVLLAGADIMRACDRIKKIR